MNPTPSPFVLPKAVRRIPADPARKAQRGVVLIEVLVALLIFSVGILALVGLQAAAAGAVADAKYRTEAAAVANSRISAMWTNPAALTSYVGTNQVVDGLPNGKMDVALANNTDVTVTVRWQPPNSATEHNFSTVARIHRR